jgi:hypothetical protein
MRRKLEMLEVNMSISSDLVNGSDWLGAMAHLRQLVADFPPWQPGFKHRSGHVGFVVDKVALGQVSFEYFGFPCQCSWHQLLHNHHHLSTGTGTIGP